MRLARVRSIMNMHSWPDHALNLVNTAANITGIVAAALVLVSLAVLYFTGNELTERAKGMQSALPANQAYSIGGASKQSDAELKAARGSEKEKASRLARVEKELAAAQQSEKAKTSRVSQVETELAAARQAEKTKASRVTEVEADLTAARQVEKATVARVTQIEAELAAAKHSEEAKAARITAIEIELAAAKRSEEAKALRVAEVEAELAATRQAAEEAKWLAKQLEGKHGPRKITPDQRSRFLNALNGHPRGKIIVSAFFDNKETHDFGAEIQGLLKESGFELIERAPLNFFTTSRPSSGVRIGCDNVSNPPSHFSTVRKAFEAMGLETPTARLINAKENDVVEIQITPR